MKRIVMLLASLLALTDVHATRDFACMQDCVSQGYHQSRCVTLCESGPAAQGGMMNQPGLPKNPAFEQMPQAAPQQRPPPAVADPQCMKDCRKRGYDYLLCQKQCSYQLYGR